MNWNRISLPWLGNVSENWRNKSALSWFQPCYHNTTRHRSVISGSVITLRFVCLIYRWKTPKKCLLNQKLWILISHKTCMKICVMFNLTLNQTHSGLLLVRKILNLSSSFKIWTQEKLIEEAISLISSKLLSICMHHQCSLVIIYIKTIFHT